MVAISNPHFANSSLRVVMLRHEAALAATPPSQLSRMLRAAGFAVVRIGSTEFVDERDLARFWAEHWLKAGGDPERVPHLSGMTLEQRQLLQGLNVATGVTKLNGEDR